MAKVTLVFAVLLIALGLVGYLGTGSQYPTALIPTWIGIALLLCGLITLARPAVRKHAMHLAALLGVFGFIGGFMPLFRSEFNFAKASAVSGVLMSGLSLLFVVLCVKSFIDAKKARQQG